MKQNLFVIFLIAGLILVTVIVFGVIFLRLYYFSDEKAVADWAKKNRLTVVKNEKRSFSESPYPAMSFDSDQKVYRVTVKDENGNERNGWLRCHGLEKGLIMERVEVIWDSN